MNNPVANLRKEFINSGDFRVSYDDLACMLMEWIAASDDPWAELERLRGWVEIATSGEPRWQN